MLVRNHLKNRPCGTLRNLKNPVNLHFPRAIESCWGFEPAVSNEQPRGGLEVGAGGVAPKMVGFLVVGRVGALHPAIEPGRDEPVARPEAFHPQGERMGPDRPIQGRLRPRRGPSG